MKNKLTYFYWTRKLSVHAIAKKFNVSHVTILHWFKKYNIKTRNRSEAQIGKFVSKKTRLKQSIAHIGMIPANKGKKSPNISGSKHWNFGNHKTGIGTPNYRGAINTTCKCGKPKAHKSKVCKDCYHTDNVCIIKCAWCNKEKEIWNCLKKEHNFCCRACKDQWASENQTGIKATGYIHGQAHLPYAKTWTKKLKEQIRNRDNFTCQICGKSQLDFQRRLSIHHIDYNKENCKEYNLISLCVHCHGLTNKNRNSWIEYFQELLSKDKI